MESTRRKIITYAILIIGSFFLILPFLWMISTSFKVESEIFSQKIVWIPKTFTAENYSAALEMMPVFKYMINTLMIAIPKMTGEVFVSAAVAFGFARYNFKGKNVIFMILLGTMMLPGEVTLIPSFIVWANLGFMDTYVPLVFPAFFGATGFIFFLRMYFETFPKDLEESAYMDGASDMKIFVKIFIPLAKPALITIALWSFLGTWNDLLGQLIYINSVDKYTVQLGLATFSSMTGEVLWGPLMAASTLVLLPVMSMLLFAQKYFVEGIKTSGIKG